jgi:hypothetical protein
MVQTEVTDVTAVGQVIDVAESGQRACRQGRDYGLEAL